MSVLANHYSRSSRSLVCLGLVIWHCCHSSPSKIYFFTEHLLWFPQYLFHEYVLIFLILISLHMSFTPINVLLSSLSASILYSTILHYWGHVNFSLQGNIHNATTTSNGIFRFLNVRQFILFDKNLKHLWYLTLTKCHFFFTQICWDID